jgi:hypothetical protein
VQTFKGAAPQALCASDWAAMFELRILPVLAKVHGRGSAGSAEYQQECRKFSQQHLGGAPCHFPFFLSIDNASQHPHGLRRLLTPRSPPPELLKMQREEILQTLCKLGLNRERSDQVGQLYGNAIAMQRAGLMTQTQMQDMLLELYYTFCDQDDTISRPDLFHLHRRVLHPHQFMPLTSKTPDLHQPVEHFVGTLKGRVYKWAREDGDIYSDELLEAGTWQVQLDRLVAVTMEGPLESAAAPMHVQGSLAKWGNCIRIVAAEAGEEVECVVEPGKHGVKKSVGRPKKQQRCEERGPVTKIEYGTAGRWPPAAYC